MRIAILGTRGIPASYGGYETFAEELSSRLVERGHHVTVYCRQRPLDPSYRGTRLVYIPTIRNKYLDTLVHTGLSTLHLLFRRHDAVLYCNAANAVFTILPRLAGMPVALNVDGIERHRKKWNRAARTWYHLSEFLATRFPTVVVTDARQIARYYEESYGKRSVCIPYGAPLERDVGTGTLWQLGVQPNRYLLYVTRFEPENNPLLVREAFEMVDPPEHLVLVGDAPYASQYIARIRDTSHPRVHIPGAIYGQGYHQLQTHCLLYVHATEVGGTHPALIEAMGKGCLVLYLDTPENAEVAADAGIPFEKSTLPDVLRMALSLPAEEQQHYRQKARRRAASLYSWDAVTDLYEDLFGALKQRTNPLTVQWEPQLAETADALESREP
jgi:glycosyltransferase involved in cell wall biosynthesis